jgi:hypothetical protein
VESKSVKVRLICSPAGTTTLSGTAPVHSSLKTPLPRSVIVGGAGRVKIVPLACDSVMASLGAAGNVPLVSWI